MIAMITPIGKLTRMKFRASGRAIRIGEENADYEHNPYLVPAHGNLVHVNSRMWHNHPLGQSLRLVLTHVKQTLFEPTEKPRA